MIDLKKLQYRISKEDEPILVSITYDEFTTNIEDIIKILGNKGIVMFAESNSVIYFDAVPQLRLGIKNKRYFVRKDFEKLGPKFEIIGQGPDEVSSSFIMFLEDLKSNFLKIIVILILFLLVINPFSYDLDIIRLLTEKLIDVIGIFIGMVFVFIGFFYGDKDRTIDVYKKGLCYKEFSTDRYIINLAIVELALLCFTLLFSHLSSAHIPKYILDFCCLRNIINARTKYWICCCMISVAITILVIEFDALINYYLKNMRNKYFIDAVEEKIRERK